MISIIDYGMGNLGSVANMFKRIGVESEIIRDKSKIEKATKLLLPGVGAFGNAIKLIDELGFRSVLDYKVLEQKVPILGICLGMQLLVNGSEESEGAVGLGYIQGAAIKFKFDDLSIKIPHMGWNHIHSSKANVLIEELPDDAKFYFVHSYYVKCVAIQDELASTSYGHGFSSMLQKDNVYGAQFHPEKSHKYGMKILENFSKI
jgi:imidazole glycerol-phosphate synthase subunit HisH